MRPEHGIVEAEQALAQLDRYDTIIDVRSEGEFSEDHIPGAISCPVLSDDERREVGTMDRQQSSFEARRRGAAMVARNIAGHLEQRFAAGLDVAQQPARFLQPAAQVAVAGAGVADHLFVAAMDRLARRAASCERHAP